MTEQPAPKVSSAGSSIASKLSESLNDPLFKDDLYYLDFVQFEVEDTIIRVPRYHFTNSPTSRQGPQAQVGEDPDEETIQLPDVQLEDFHQLLTILHPLTSEDEPKTLDHWISVLYLSTRYQLYKIRQLAIAALSKFDIPSMRRILLARQFGLVDWLATEYMNLVKRSASISFEEAQDLGLTATIKLNQIREFVLKSPRKHQSNVQNQAPSAKTDVDLFNTPPPKTTPPSSLPRALSDEDRYLKNVDDVFDGEFTSANVVVTDTIERAILARSLGVIQWLRHAYVELARRSEGLTELEAEKLGLEASVGIYKVRENILCGNDGDTGNRTTTTMGTWVLSNEQECEKLIKAKFELELGDARRDGALYSGLVRSSAAVVVVKDEGEGVGGHQEEQKGWKGKGKKKVKK